MADFESSIEQNLMAMRKQLADISISSKDKSELVASLQESKSVITQISKENVALK